MLEIWHTALTALTQQTKNMSGSPSSYNASTSRESSIDHTEDSTRLIRSTRLTKLHTKPVLEGYLSLLDETIASARSFLPSSDTAPLDASVINGSHWSEAEKEIFFIALKRYGAQDLISIAREVDSKSVLQVTQYMLILQDACESLQDQEAPNVTSLATTNAANDISDDLDAELEHIAEVVEANVHDQLCAKERARYGDVWIIDETRAGMIETSDVPDAVDIEQPAPVLRPNSTTHGSTSVSEAQDLSSMALLRPISFVEIMRNVFMNDNANLAGRWDNLPIYTEDSEGPSILRSAFEDLFQIALSLTRRLVQCAIFQATSRLRAERRLDVTPVIRSVDVLSALDVLNMRQQTRYDYWIGVMKRHDIRVYSRASRFVSEQEPTPNLGTLLTKAQLQHEISHDSSNTSARSATAAASMKRDHDDYFDGESYFKYDSGNESEDYSEDDESERDQETGDLSDRHTNIIEQVNQEDEREQYWHLHDTSNSQLAENAIRATLKMPRTAVSAPPLTEPRSNHVYGNATNWREHQTYVAVWETLSPKKHRFHGGDSTMREETRRKRMKFSPSGSPTS